jgi:nicotinamidase-related amidase
MKKNHTDKNALTKSETVLLLIDVINDFEFEDGEKLFEQTRPVVANIARLKARAKKANIPSVYVNDNFGHWQDNFEKILGHCLDESMRGRPVVKLLQPEADDYFVLKPKHSGFYSTVLELLLEEFEAKKLILTGITADICVLFTANDAYMRGYQLFVPSDCVASVEADENEHALEYIERVLKADIRPSGEIELK